MLHYLYDHGHRPRFALAVYAYPLLNPKYIIIIIVS